MVKTSPTSEMRYHVLIFLICWRAPWATSAITTAVKKSKLECQKLKHVLGYYSFSVRTASQPGLRLGQSKSHAPEMILMPTSIISFFKSSSSTSSAPPVTYSPFSCLKFRMNTFDFYRLPHLLAAPAPAVQPAVPCCLLCTHLSQPWG